MGSGIIRNMGTPRILDLPQGDRPRERLLKSGAQASSNAELLAIQLGTGHGESSALDLAHQLLAEWGGLAALAQARPEELARSRGIGPAKAARICASFALANRISGQVEGEVVSGSEGIARIAQANIGLSMSERVLALVFDGANRIRRTEVVSTGSAKSCPMPVREILATVLRHDGVAFAVAHNHPAGDPTPSKTDLEATKQMRAGADAAGLRFLDHVVVTSNDWRSASVALLTQVE